MDSKSRTARIKELEDELKYKESQFWEDSPYHDMKISALRRELKDLKEEEAKESPFSPDRLIQFIRSVIGGGNKQK
ncbi:MAG: hypothetical protein GX442_18140 [Candidatus Riflebacteria bacterium]|nr:hypothetical protein [Candidatus Riflebacteria bacterium]